MDQDKFEVTHAHVYNWIQQASIKGVNIHLRPEAVLALCEAFVRTQEALWACGPVMMAHADQGCKWTSCTLCEGVWGKVKDAALPDHATRVKPDIEEPVAKPTNGVASRKQLFCIGVHEEGTQCQCGWGTGESPF